MAIEHTTDPGWSCESAEVIAATEAPVGPAARTPSGWTGNEQQLARLVRAIEAEIVPRLVMARGASAASPAATHAGAAAASTQLPLVRAPGSDDVEEFVRLLIAHEAAVASAFVHALRHQGVSLDRLCLELLAPAARRLGQMWEDDRADFTQVTVGLCRLQGVLRELSLATAPDSDALRQGPSILLVPAPGEQHMFGLLLVAEFFRRSGWQVCSEFPRSQAEVLELLAGPDHFDVIGLSVARVDLLPGLPAQIQAIRNASRNKSVKIFVGGRVFTEDRSRAEAVGADATAVDGREAVLLASRLFQQPLIGSAN